MNRSCFFTYSHRTKCVLRNFVFFFVSLLCTLSAHTQCPPNIDFEDGTFSGWTCYTGSVSASNGQNIISLTPVPGPVPGRHAMLSALPGNGFDPYGDFPQNCPNGSSHSIKLGNSIGGAQAEGVSYQFTIPANAHQYSLIYYYAVVFQDPGHAAYRQPRLQIEITNVTDTTTISCSSFAFIADSTLPGFFLSQHHPTSDRTPVWCKDWSANSIKLDGNEGKTIRLFFKTADCTLSAHFGYAYVDVNSECSGSFVGATYCHDDTAINVRAPYGYQSYTWYNNAFTQVLGTEQILHLSPPPPPGTTVAVELTPYNGYGCKDTLYAHLIDTLTLTAYAGPNILSCNRNPVRLGRPPVPGVLYHWNPSTGLDNPDVSNPILTPSISATYVLSVKSPSGGCLALDSAHVTVVFLDSSIQLIGNASYCTNSGLSSILKVNPADSIQWYRNNLPVAGAVQTQLNVTQSGMYFARLFSYSGCTASTPVKQIDIFPSPIASFNINTANQCFANHQFIFTNSSNISSGQLQYIWDLGDGNIQTSTDVTHNYSAPGNYTVKLHVTSPGGCLSDTSAVVQIYPTPLADFTVQPICVHLNVPLLNTTINNSTSILNYAWDLGNGQVSNLRNPIFNYASAGLYTIKLSVTTNQCPQTTSSKQISVTIDSPVLGIKYPPVTAVMNYPLTLKARAIGNTVFWIPGASLDNRNSYAPIFKGLNEQLFQIQLKTPHGCLTVDTQLVKTLKRIEIYVPTGFSPNGDGKNDYLLPILMGFKSVSYFRVYNRWGQLLFEMKSDKPGWDGKVNGYLQDTQAVVWMIEAEDVDGKIHHEHGSCVLIR